MPQVVMLVSMAASNWSLVPGDVIEVNEEIATSWEEHAIAKPYVPPEVKVIQHNPELPKEEPIDLTKKEEEPPALELKHVGGGWYLLPNGEKVHGKAEAEEALKSLNE